MNRYVPTAVVVACGLVYAGALALLAREPEFSLVEPLFVLGVLGGAFSLLAWGVTRRAAAALPETPPAAPREAGGVLAYLALFAVLVLGFGFTVAKGAVTAQPAQQLLLIAIKLATMVALPLALVAWLGRGRDFRRSYMGFAWRTHGLPLVAVGAALLAFQAVFGRGLTTLAELDPSAATLAWAIPACFLVASIEAGLCEEVLFRVVLQGTLERSLRSSTAAITSASLLFGLAHAPGLYLRSAHLMEGVAEPSLAWAVAYSIAVIAPAGLLFGVVWARTRSLVLVVVLHGAMDTIPHLAPFIRNWA